MGKSKSKSKWEWLTLVEIAVGAAILAVLAGLAFTFASAWLFGSRVTP